MKISNIYPMKITRYTVHACTTVYPQACNSPTNVLHVHVRMINCCLHVQA